MEFQRLIKNVNGLCDRQGHFLFQLRIHIQIRIRIQKRKQSRPKMANHAKRYAAQPWSWEHAMAGVLRGATERKGTTMGRRQQISVLDMLSLNGEIEQKSRQSADVAHQSSGWINDSTPNALRKWKILSKIKQSIYKIKTDLLEQNHRDTYKTLICSKYLFKHYLPAPYGRQ